MRLRRWPTASWLLIAITAGLIVLRFFAPSTKPVESVFEESSVEVSRVIDGDTLLLASGHRVRLIGVDTPETKHPDRPVERLGKQAYRFTQGLVGDGPVRLEFDRERRDPYRRLLAYVYLSDGRLLNEELIRAGLSEAETRFPFRSDMKRRFESAEDFARAANVGLWAGDSQMLEPSISKLPAAHPPTVTERN